MTSEQTQAARRRNLYGQEGWVEVACVVADLIRHSGHVAPSRSKTDLDGTYGDLEFFTEWATRKFETPVLREHRWPSQQTGDPDPFRCEHYVPILSPAVPSVDGGKGER